MLGLAAGLFALIPDIDVLYAFTEIAEVTSGFYGFKDSFWDASQQTYGGFTHSLVTSRIAVSMFSINYLTEEKISGWRFYLLNDRSILFSGRNNQCIDSFPSLS